MSKRRKWRLVLSARFLTDTRLHKLPTKHSNAAESGCGKTRLYPILKAKKIQGVCAVFRPVIAGLYPVQDKPLPFCTVFFYTPCMDLSNVVIVLCRPCESKNIGSVCRAMLSMGLRRLRIVGAQTEYNTEHIKTLAVHAFELWEQAEFYGGLVAALNDCSFSVGATRRHGQKRKSYFLLPEDFALKVSSVAAQSVPAAVVFGNEKTGLTDDELNLCNAALTIPSDPKSGSLNLSHAVQIVAYELYRKALPAERSFCPITRGRLQKTVDMITDNLCRIGFFSLGGRDDMERFWLSVLAKAALFEDEALYVEKIFTKAAALSLKHKIDVGV